MKYNSPKYLYPYNIYICLLYRLYLKYLIKYQNIIELLSISKFSINYNIIKIFDIKIHLLSIILCKKINQIKKVNKIFMPQKRRFYINYYFIKHILLLIVLIFVMT